MAIYQWKGIEGSRLSSGEIEALNSQDATEKLKIRKIVVTNLTIISGQEQEGGLKSSQSNRNEHAQNNATPKHKAKKIKNVALMIFTKKFATMIDAGLPINKTLSMLEEQQNNANFRFVVHTIRSSVEGGIPLSAAFAMFPQIFDSIYINLLKAGENSGKLTTFLQKMVEHLEKNEKIRSKVKSALTYPIILLCVAFVVISIMMIKVVPVFQQMFSSMGHKLPAPTLVIISISEFFRDPMRGGLTFFIITSIILTIRYLKKHNLKFKRIYDQACLKLPLIGEIIEKSILARIAMVQGNLSMAGVPITKSLEIVAKTISNTIYTEAFDVIKEGVESGNSLSSLYSANKIFPPTFHQMLAVGEETGKMEEMFASTAQYYEEEFDMAVDRLTEALEPIMIIFMGITVGFIIVAMYMPIFQIGDMVG